MTASIVFSNDEVHCRESFPFSLQCMQKQFFDIHMTKASRILLHFCFEFSDTSRKQHSLRRQWRASSWIRWPHSVKLCHKILKTTFHLRRLDQRKEVETCILIWKKEEFSETCKRIDSNVENLLMNILLDWAKDDLMHQKSVKHIDCLEASMEVQVYSSY